MAEILAELAQKHGKTDELNQLANMGRLVHTRSFKGQVKPSVFAQLGAGHGARLEHAAGTMLHEVSQRHLKGVEGGKDSKPDQCKRAFAATADDSNDDDKVRTLQRFIPS